MSLQHNQGGAHTTGPRSTPTLSSTIKPRRFTRTVVHTLFFGRIRLYTPFLHLRSGCPILSRSFRWNDASCSPTYFHTQMAPLVVPSSSISYAKTVTTLLRRMRCGCWVMRDGTHAMPRVLLRQPFFTLVPRWKERKHSDSRMSCVRNAHEVCTELKRGRYYFQQERFPRDGGNVGRSLVITD